MEVIPAIDIRSGRCVRLYQGDYEKETVYADDPVAVASRWRDGGAGRLHVVDLDGAATGEPVNLDAIRAIAATVGIPVQVGGGIRSLETARRLLSAGIERVVLGTAAVRDPGTVRTIVADLGTDRVVLAVDALDGRVAVQGWTEGTSMEAIDLVRNMQAVGVGRFLYTDISRDGTLTEPNFAAIEDLAGHTRLPIQASGGISTTEHVARLAAIGVEGAIVGRALYTADIDLRAAIDAANSDTGGQGVSRDGG